MHADLDFMITYVKGVFYVLGRYSSPSRNNTPKDEWEVAGAARRISAINMIVSTYSLKFYLWTIHK